ncbi:MAG: molybdopterin-dependent oxidoreductase [Chloroflexi bacterium]|nr:molybdopterin-dependent oxidoreductase [Chloroflexota bacterium]
MTSNVRRDRRNFIKLGAASATAAAAAALLRDLAFLQTTPAVENPLQFYPSRDWEKVYRELYRTDETFTFLCAPNDTHNCLLTASVKSGVMTRIEPSYQYGNATDLYGNRASHRWDPRACSKGLGLVRRFYGDRRIKGAFVRKGYLDWANAGFPRDAATGRPPQPYFQRGKDEWVKLPWDEAFALVAKATVDIATTYTGADGIARLQAQGYDEAMVARQGGIGTQVLKYRGGMPFLGATRIMGFYRFANMLALLDARLRGVGPEAAVGGRVWDSYTWHTDLPPGHPLVTGHQTVEFELFTAENADLITLWGMNWICTKMPDSHWLTEARLRGAKVIVISADYQATANKADEVLILRPGTDAALALGAARVIVDEGLYDARYVKESTDLPLLVRMDTLKLLRASDFIPNYRPAPLSNYVRVMGPGQSALPVPDQAGQQIPQALREEWGDYAVWDTRTGQSRAVTRDQVGHFFAALGVDPALEGTFRVTTVDGQTVEVQPVFDLVRRYLEGFDPQTVSEITWVPADGIRSLARQIAAHPSKTLLTSGIGPNHFFNADLKDRALFLLAVLTSNVGHLGGTLGAYAGNYRTSVFNGLPQYIQEDPFHPALEPGQPVPLHSYTKAESAHYYNYGDRPLRVGNRNFTGDTHMPTPTKLMWFANSNSLLGNAKGFYDVMANTLPKIETVVVNDWWWTMSCEYADVVFGVDSWAEFKHPDMAGSCTNPFVSIFPRTPLPRLFDTVSDLDTTAGVARALAHATGDARFDDYWKFVHEGRTDVYLQRVVDHSTTLRGYVFQEMEQKAQRGQPTLVLFRTYPRVGGWEQTQESQPWYTRSGRLEFYRDETEFIEYGENLPVYREPVDATFYEPNVIVGGPHPALRPTPPEQYGLRSDDLSTDVRQVRNVQKSWADLKQTQHPRRRDGLTHLFITPKYRHGAHTTPTDVDTTAMLFGPFGDVYRHDKRQPWVNEAYVDINPRDAKALGIDDGDYVWLDADPEDRPYRGWKATDPDYKVARLMCRARYYNGVPPGVLRMWYNMYQASHGSVQAHESRPDGLAKNPRTGYQASFRYGGHQAATRAWLRPTMLTDSIVRKENFGQLVGKGFASDIYCANGAPKESVVKITRAEAGGLGGQGRWRPAALGLRPTYENEWMQHYLAGDFIKVVNT